MRGRFVCLTGPSGSGKDTLGTHLVRVHGFRRVAIADPIKRHVGALFDLDREQLWGDERNIVVPRLGLSPRAVYQRFGSAVTDIDPEAWIRLWMAEVTSAVVAGADVVCTDLRTQAEFAAARRAGARIWRISRTAAGAPGRLAEHVTETALVDMPAVAFDAVLTNEGTLAELFAIADLQLRNAQS